MTVTSTTATSVKTTCPYCGVGCGVNLSLPSASMDALPPVSGDLDHPANFGRLCVKGSSLAQTIQSDDRLLTPRVNGQPVVWASAIETVSAKISQVIKEHGPNAFAFYLSGQILTEDYYVANKLAKGFIGTANVDTNSRLCMASAVVGYKRAFGSDTVPCNYEDLERCDLLIMVGSNAAWTHPILYQRIAAAKKQRPAMKIVVIDPRETATCDIADLHLAIKPGSDAAIFSFLLQYSSQADILDGDFIAHHTNGFADALAQAHESTPTLSATAAFCGVSEQDLASLARWWCDTPNTVTFYSQGVNQSSSGVDKCNAIINCHLATGRIGKEGAGPFSITGQPNAMGGREVGGLANQLAAHMDFATPGAQELVQRFWQAPNMATENGLKAVDLFQAMEEGKVKVVWIMSTNPMVSLPDTAQVRRALEKCELVIVSDCKAHTDTTVMADVLFPATGWSEKDGTVTNSERRISRQRGLLPAPGDAKHDWWAICEVAKRLGYQSAFSYRNVHEIFAEHAALSAFENNGKRDFDIGHFSQITKAEYDALTPVQWPVPKGRPEGTKRMFEEGRFFTPDGRARFVPITPALPKNATSQEWPFMLNTGRVRDQWHTMTRTGDAASLAKHTAQPYVEIHPKDAKRLGIKDKTLVRLTSPYGEVLLKAKLSRAVAPTNVFAPIHWTQQFANASVVSNLIPQVVDPLSGQPESKHTPVQLEAVTDICYGMVVSTTELTLSDCLYWCLVPSEQGFHYEVVWPQGQTQMALKALNKRLKGVEQAEWLEYANPVTQQLRLAQIVQRRLVLLVYLHPQPEAIVADWLVSTLASAEPLSTQDRIAMLVGAPANVEEKGDIICSCYQVGSWQIEKAVADGACSLETLGTQLKCGTNCGSCLPELKRFIPTATELSA
ncbi:molybdopterin-dependent oxidoreductase [Marinomonas sp. M1K-6]|uniref:Molybdopterin-dependent oxidoreductase n=1 Tax=Marinomonas profundi TaxID=2726122 RepID=A0A847QW06_9GAMM|nr:nitrate reductase [Marinomonas profundi]NLQ16129.1 molybdopterin-dependent oxidoreductase [Marinomonas profundi]UDV03286.1 nitrate reductase [Marinomonas profundi]